MRLPVILISLLPAVCQTVRADESATNAAEIATALLGDVRRPVPFAATVTATYVVPFENGKFFMAVADGTGAVAVNGNTNEFPVVPVPGDRVKIGGIIPLPLEPRRGNVILDTLKVFGRADMPDTFVFTTNVVTLADLESGTYDWQPTIVRGLVREIDPSETNPNWIYLILGMNGETLYVSIPLNETRLDDYAELEGREVEITGYCTPRDGSRRHSQGRIFQTRGRNDIQALTPVHDPFDEPDVSSLRRLRTSVIATLGRHRAEGLVLAVTRHGEVLLRSGNHSVSRVSLKKVTPPRPGDFITAVGFPESDLFNINLSRAIWKPAQPMDIACEPTVDVSVDQILRKRDGSSTINALYHGHDIRLRGTIRNMPNDPSKDPLLIVSDDSVIPVDVHVASAKLGQLTSGTEITVSGICMLETENWRPNLVFPQIKSFSLVMTDPDGFVVLSQPPWWTPSRIWMLVAALVAALAAILAWSFSLRLLAERRGRELLRGQVENVRSRLQVEERTRLAVELHDSLAQNLTAVSLELESGHTSIAMRMLKSCRDELRNCLWDLRSRALEEIDLTAAIRRTLAPQIRMEDAKLTVRFNVPRARLSDNTAHALLLIIRELVLNAFRHGQAESVRVAGSLDSDGLRFSVKDNGVGFDPENCPGLSDGHFGLTGVRERLTRLGGSLQIESSAGCGTKISAFIPTHGKASES